MPRGSSSSAQELDLETLSSGIWTASTPLQFPVPETNEEDSHLDDDPWVPLAEERRMEVETRCNAWKDQIQSMLTFTGLFSAVVASFVASTYNDLSVDPGETTNIILAQIVLRLDVVVGLANISSIQTGPQSPPSVPSSLVQIHTFWFLSLALSLSTATVAILCLQWIQEYQRPLNVTQGRKVFAVYSLRTESFNRWHIPTIIAYLPVFLQVSLILFFIGLIYFLLLLGEAIAIPTIVVIAFTLFFIVYTAAAPTVQIFYLYLRSILRLGPVSGPQYPCPYRSPQAWRLYIGIQIMVRVTLGLLSALLLAIALTVMVPLFIIPPHCLLVFHPDILKALWKLLSTDTSFAYRLASLEWRPVHPAWLGFEEFSSPTSEGPSETEISQGMTSTGGLDLKREWYHATQGLSTISVVSTHHPYVVFRCAQSVPHSISTSATFPEPDAFVSLNSDSYNKNIFDRRLLASWTDPPSEACHVEYQMMLINTYPGSHNPTSGQHLALHQVELFIRVLAAIYAGPRWLECAPSTRGFSPQTFVPKLLRTDNHRPLGLTSTPGGDECMEQLALIWCSFSQTLLKHEPPVALGEYHRSTDIIHFTHIVVSACGDCVNVLCKRALYFSPPILHALQAFSRSHRLFSSFLLLALENISRGLPYDNVRFRAPWKTVMAYLVSTLRKSDRFPRSALLRWDALDKVQKDPGISDEQRKTLEAYVSSFKELFRLADTLLLVLDTEKGGRRLLGSASYRGFGEEARMGLLQGFGMERVAPCVPSSYPPCLPLTPPLATQPTSVSPGPSREGSGPTAVARVDSSPTSSTVFLDDSSGSLNSPLSTFPSLTHSTPSKTPPCPSDVVIDFPFPSS